MTRDVSEFTVPSAEFQENPYPAFAAMRSQCPVYQLGDAPLYLVTRYDDLVAVAKDVEVFSNRRNPPGMDDPELAQIMRTEGYPEVPAMQNNDAPEHNEFKAMIADVFKPGAVRQRESEVRRLVDELIDDFIESGRCDLVADFANILPINLISRILGVPDDRAADVRRWSHAYSTFVSPHSRGDHDPKELLAEIIEMQKFIADELMARRDEPRDDVLSELANGRMNDGSLPELQQQVWAATTLVVAGHETTSYMIANTMKAIVGQPGVLASVTENPGKLPAVVEETLRHDSSVTFLVRRTMRDTELAGTAIPEGSTLMLMWVSGNHDDTHFTEADTFNPDRPGVRSHLAFGFGAHYCLGAHLGRLEIRVAFEQLLSRLEGLRLVEQESDLRCVDSPHLRAPRRLVLEFKPGERVYGRKGD